MPVDFKHPQYTRSADRWRRCRTATAGEDEVKMGAEMHLPRLKGQSEPEYEAYKARAQFFGSVDRTRIALSGAIHRKSPSVEFPDSEREMLDSLGKRRESLDALANMITDQVLTVGRCGIMVDAQISAGPDRAPQPYITQYLAENITNWHEEVIDDKLQLTMVVLREVSMESAGDDEFDKVDVERYRVLRLRKGGVNFEETEDENGDTRRAVIAGEGDGYTYYQEIYEKRELGEGDNMSEEWVLVQVIVPKGIGGRDLDSIPFIFVNPTNCGPDIEKPPLLDLADVAFSYYRTSADLEHGRHFTALPTPWAAGFDAKGALFLGSSRAWVSENAQAKAGFLEFTGAGLSSLFDGLQEKKKEMAVLGGRLLEESRAGVEAAETHKLRQNGESSVLANISMSVSEGITWALKFALMWIGKEEKAADISFELNRDFNIIGLSSQDLTALMGAYQAGLISWPTFFYNIQRGELIPDGITADDELERIALDGPQLAVGPAEDLSEEEPEEEEEPDEEEDEEDEEEDEETEA